MQKHQYNIDLFKELYFFELELKEKITNKSTVYLTIIPLLSGGLLYFGNNLKDIKPGFWFINYCILLCLFLISLIVAITYAIRVLVGNKYLYLTTPQPLHDETEKLIQKYGNQPRIIKVEIEKLLYKEYMELTEINSNLNIKRSSWGNKAGIWIVITAIIGAILVVPYIFGKNDSVDKVEVVNLKVQGAENNAK